MVSLADNDDPAVTVQFGAAAYTATEDGTAATVAVTLSADPERTVTVPLTVTAGNEATTGDYTLSQMSVTFNSGEMSATLTVTAEDDSEDDDGESITIGFGTLPSGVTATSPETTTVSLVDNDDPAVTVRFGSGGYTATEGGTAATVEVVMSADPERDVIVPLEVVQFLGLAVAADFTFSPTEVMFVAGGPTTKSITVTATDDDVDNASRRVLFGFGDLPDGVTAVPIKQTIVDLADNDDVQVTATFETSSYIATEGGAAVTIEVTLSEAPSAGDFPKVELVVTLVGATADDYELSESDLQFGPMRTTQSFTVTAVADGEDESGESITIAFGTLSSTLSAGSITTVTVSLVDRLNFAAQGDPLAHGDRTVGATLTADTGGITDANGLTNPRFTYQWQRVDGGTAADVTGETTDTYTLIDADLGKRIQLQVQFTDDIDKLETRSGPATSIIVGLEPRILVSNLGQTSNGDSRSERSTPFVTGTHSLGYSIDSIDIDRSPNTTVSSDFGEFRLYRSSTDTPINRIPRSSPIVTVRGPDRVSGSRLTFDAPSRVKLDPGATYHVVLTRSEGAAIGCRLTGQTADSTSLAGFSILRQSLNWPSNGGLTRNGCLFQIRGLELVAPKFVQSLRFSSSPASPAVYVTGEVIEVTATMNEAVTRVGPAPVLLLQVGANDREMTYVASASSTTSWVFRYTLIAADRDDDGVSFERNALRAYADADLSHRGIGADLTRQVNAVGRVLTHRVTSQPLAPGWYGPGEQIQFTIEFSLPVTVVGDPQLEFSVTTPGPHNEFATYLSGSGDRELVFSYTVLVADDDPDGIFWGVNSLQLDSDDSITAVHNSEDAVLDHAEHRYFPDHRIDQNPRAVSQTVTSVPTHGSSDTYGLDDVITFQVEFNQAVTVAGDPRLRFNIDSGTDDEYASYVSGSGGNTLEFSYTVLATDSDTDGIYLYDDPLNYPASATDSIVGATNSLPAVNSGIGTAGDRSGHKVVGTIGYVNSPAQGDPLVQGEREVGSILTADTSGISDADGLTTPMFTYQWQHADGGTAADITGAITGTYTLTDADIGKRIQVQVQLTDDTHTSETRTGPASSLVVPEPRLLVSNIGRPSGGNTGGILSTGFVVGSHSLGYAIDSATVYRSSTALSRSPQDAEIRVYDSSTHTDLVSRRPRDLFMTADDLISANGVALTYGSRSRLKLEADATYHLVLAASSGRQFGCLSTHGGLNSGSLAGFSIIGRALYFPFIITYWPNPCYLAIRGFELLSSAFVQKLEFSSSPVLAGMYATGEVIEATVTLTEAVSFDDPAPVLLLQVGANEREMTYVASQSTTTSWVFHYTLIAADRDDDGVSLERNPLRGYADADLSIRGLSNDRTRHVNAAPTVLSHRLTSRPLAPNYYGPGEQIQFTIEFSLPVTVVGVPQLELNVTTPDPENEFASYLSGSGTNTLVFSYTVRTIDDDDQGGIWWGADSLQVVDGVNEIIAVYNGLDAVLDHASHGFFTGHRIDQRPRAVSQTVTSDAAYGTNSDTYALGEEITFEVVFNQAVTVAGSPQLHFSIDGPDDEFAAYVSGSGSNTLVFSYTVLATDSDTDGIYLFKSNVFTLESGDSIVGVVNGLAIVNDHFGREGALPDHKVDGTLTQANLAAQGDPLASGERKVGETLTADTSGITDHNGLTDPMFTYQWQRVDSGTASNITGETAATYTLTDDDLDKRIRLHVEFTDDSGSAETLTGPATSRIVRALRSLINTVGVSGGETTEEYTRSFKTATHTHGYMMDSIVMGRNRTTAVTNDRAEFRLFASTTHAEFSKGRATDRIMTISGADSVSSDGRYLTFTPSGLKLEPQTIYHAMLTRSSGPVIGCFYGFAFGNFIAPGFSIHVGSFQYPPNANVNFGATSTRNCQMNIRGAELSSPTYVENLEFTSPLAPYSTGDVIELTATLTGPTTTVDPSSVVLLQVGANVRAMTYARSASSSRSWVFRYTVTADDNDNDGVSVARNALRGYADADLAHRGIGADLRRSANAAARVLSHRLTSSPLAPNWYGPGEQIQFTIEFSLPVTVVGAPQLQFNVTTPDPENEFASYLSGSGTNTLVFSYTVRATDGDDDGIWWGANSLRVADGVNEIIGVYNGLDAELDHGEHGFFKSHNIDQNPRVVSQEVTSDPSHGTPPDTYGAGDAIIFEVVFNQALTVTGDPRLEFSVSSGTDNEYATYVSGDGTNTLVFSYTVLPTDADPDGIYLVRQPLTYESGESIVGAVNSLEAANHVSGPERKLPNHKIDGTIGVSGALITVHFGATSYTATEGGAAATVEVTLSADPGRTVTIPLSVTAVGMATTGDYTLSASQLIFYTGETTASFTVTADDDMVDDDGESITIGFGTLPTGISAASPETTMVSLADDDVPAVTVQFDEIRYDAFEGGLAATVTVTLSEDPERTVTVMLDVSHLNGATATDYTLSDTSVTFAAGQTTATLTLTVVDDSVNDDDSRLVEIEFQTPLPDGVTAGLRDSTLVRLIDNDDPAVTVQFLAAAYTATEGGLTAIVQLALSADPGRTVTIPLTVTLAGGATIDDYTLSGTSVTFDADDTSATVTVTAEDDTHDDDGESIMIGFGALPPGVSAASPDSTTVSLADNDFSGVTVDVSFGSASTTAIERGPAVSVQVTLSADPERTVIVPLSVEELGGATLADYNLSETELTFDAGEMDKTFTVTAVDDSIDDNFERLILNFGTLPPGVEVGAVSFVFVSLVDNDFGTPQGRPLVSGKRQPGETLDAVTGDIRNANGSPVTVSAYQWQRVDGGTATDITGATMDTYTLTDDDLGKRIGVQAQFNDVYDKAVTSDGHGTSFIVPAARVLVSNRSHASTTGSSGSDASNGFGTGAHPFGYAIDSVVMRRSEGVSSDLAEFRLYDSRSDAVPLRGSRLLTVSGPDAVNGELLTFDTPKLKLDQDTTYHVVLTTSVSQSLGCRTASSGLDSGSLAGFTIVPEHHLYPGSTGTGFRPCAFSINGIELLSSVFVEKIEFTSSPAQAGMYATGEVIELTATLSEAATFEGRAPEIWIALGAFSTVMTYEESASTSTLLVFRRTVTAHDQDDDGVSLARNELRGHADADLSHRGIAAELTRQVNAAPRLLSQRVTSSPAAPNFYGPGEQILFTLEFSLPVTVVGAPRLEFSVMTPSPQNEFATYLSGSGSTELVFAYSVGTDDDDPDGIEWGADSLRIGSGSITGVYNSLVARLTHADSGELSGHRIDQRPLVLSQEVTSTPTHGSPDTYGLDDVITFALVFNQTMTVTGEPRLRFSVTGGDDEYATYQSGSGSDTLVFAYTVLATDADSDGIYLYSDPLTIDTANSIAGAANSVNPLNHISGQNRKLPDHKIDGTIGLGGPLVTVQFGAAAYTATEDGAAATIEVTLSDDPQRTVVVMLSVTPMGGATPADYMVSATELTFISGETSATFTVTAVDDADIDDSESITIDLSSLSPGVTPVSPDTATVKLADDVQVPAQGDPLPRGERKVGATLRADIDGITDTDGLTTPMFTYQWQRVDGGTAADITGETTNTYTLTDADLGKRIQVRVRFTDDENHLETLTGPASSLVVPEPRLLVGNTQGASSGGSPGRVSTGVVVGMHPLGYAIDSATMYRESAANSLSPQVAEIRVYDSTSSTSADNRLPVDLIMTADQLLRVNGTVLVYGSRSRQKLDPGQTYHLILAETSGPTFGCSGGQTGVDNGSLPGFSILGVTRISPTFGDLYNSPCILAIRGFELLSSAFVRKLEFNSSPAQPGTYATGEVIEANVTLTEAVSLDDPAPVLLLQVGANEREMTYVASESSATSWVFRYTVIAADRDDDGVSIERNPLRGYADADLSHRGIGDLPLHGVNAVATVLSHRLTSSPLAPGWYGPGEQIQFTIEFSRLVRVVGAPQLEFNVTTPEGVEFASYLSGSGTNTLVFSYTVGAIDDDTDGIWWGGNSLRVVDGVNEIIGVYNSVDAELDHTALNGLPGHRIVQDPRVVSQEVTSTPTHGDSDTYGLDDVITFAVVFNQVVTVTGSPELRFSIDGSGDEYADYVSGGGSNTLVFSYTVLAADDDTDGIYLYSDPLTYESGESIVGAVNGLAVVNKNVGRAGGLPGHRIDGTIGLGGPRVTVQFGAAAYTATEGGTAATVEVTLSEAPLRSVDVALSVTEATGGATSADYMPLPASVTFAAGQTSRTFTVTAFDDSDDDNGESITIGFGTLSPGVTAASPETATVSLVDNDFTVQFGAAAYTATEDGPAATVTVTLSEDPLRTVVVMLLVTEEDGGATPADYMLSATELTFVAGLTSATFTVTAFDDSVDDDGESITIGFGTLPRGVTAANPDTTTVSLADNDNSPAQGNVLVHGERTVGAILSADTSGITDANGLTAPTFTYQWQRVDGGTPSDIAGANVNTYTLTEDDAGKRIQLQVQFSDDTSNPETRTGPATSLVVHGLRVLVSNIGLVTQSATTSNRSNGFETGAHSLGYAIDNVELIRSATSPADNTVSAFYLYASTSETDPLDRKPMPTPIMTVNGPPSVSGSELTFVTPSNVKLEPSTTYHVVLTHFHSDVIACQEAGPGLDSSSLAGFSIFERSYAHPAYDDPSDVPCAFRINGFERISANSVVTVEFTSSPPSTYQYQTDEVVEVTATLSEAVTSDGPPALNLEVGGAERAMEFAASASSPTSWVFRYTVTAADRDDDGVSIGRNALQGYADANLSHRGIGPDPRRSVNPPLRIVAWWVASEPLFDLYYRPDEEIEFVIGFSLPVTVEGDPELEFDVDTPMGVMERATYESGSGTNTLTFSYTVRPGDEDLDGIVWDDNSLRLDADDSITGVDSGLDAVLVQEFPGSDNPISEHRIDQRPRVRFAYPELPPRRTTTVDTFWAGDTITFTVEFYQPVKVTGDPRLRFDIDSGTGDEYATYQGGGDTNILTFTYTVLATDSDDDGIYTYEDPFTYETGDSIVGLVNGLAAVNFISQQEQILAYAKVDGTLTN